MRLIDATPIIRALQKEEEYGADMDYPIMLLKDAPTIEAKPVVHAHWEKVREGLHVCSYCKVKAPIESDEYDYMESLSAYCPLCGALMDEVTE